MRRRNIFTRDGAGQRAITGAMPGPARQCLALRLLAGFGAMLLAALCCPSAARAADQTHMFLRNDFDPSHCWEAGDAARTAPAMAAQNPGSPAAGKSPGVSLLGQGITGMKDDPQLAVSPKYVLVLEAHKYVFYDRATNKPLAQQGCVPVNAQFSGLFAPLLLPFDKGAKNKGDVNYQLELGSHPKYPCDPVHYFDPEAGDPSGCIQGNYDARAYFDFDTRRFWIVAAARNHIWKCPTDLGACGDEARRYVFVAVSKDEDPRKGFWEYVLVRDYADWPLFSVRNGRLLVGHNNARRLYVFDANKLASGSASDPFLGQYGDADFPESDKITPVTQYSDADGLSLVLGRKGAKLTVYAFKNPLVQPVRKTVTLGHAPGWAMQPVYRLGKFYFTKEVCGGTRCVVDVHRVTAGLSGSPEKVSSVSDEYFALADKKADYRMPGVLVEENGAVLVWYLRFTADKPQDARYQVLYAKEGSFREAAVLRASEKGSKESFLVGDLQLGGAAEPGKLGFWITHVYTDADGNKLQAVGRIDPPSKP